MERQVHRTLSRDSGLSQSSLQRLFRACLSRAPALSVKPALKERTYLLIDGSYFPGNLCIVLYMDHALGYVQLYRDSDGERYSEIYEDLMNLRALGVKVYSVTCDGHRSILKAVRKAFPGAVIQRCLVHIKRQVKTYLSARPQSDAAKELLRISRRLTSIKTHEQSALWLLEMHLWEQRHKAYVNARSFNPLSGRYWYTHKSVHSAYRLVKNAAPNLFAYLDDAQIPSTTNKLEGHFAHLKEKLTLHHGLRAGAKKAFIKWYLHFKNGGLR